LARHFPAPSADAAGCAIPAATAPATPGVSAETEPTGIHLPDARVRASSASPPSDSDSDSDLDAVVEPSSWAALAYNGFMWWASAGEQPHGAEQDETAHDNSLLSDLAPSASMSPPAAAAVASADAADEARKELAIIAYFHRLTTQMLHVLSGQIDYNDRYGLAPYTDAPDAAAADAPPPRAAPDADPAADDDSDDDDAAEGDRLLQRSARDSDADSIDNDLVDDGDDDLDSSVVRLDARVFRDMGVDMWSRRDAEFVAALAERYFGRQTRVEGKGVEICGVRVC
jgi:hypothetical protein